MLALALVIGCARTVTPVIPHDTQASWDGNQQNSGFIGWAQDGSGIITPHARDRYNALVSVYGTNFAPVLKLDAGLIATTTNTFLIDAQHLVYFDTMNRWKKEGR